MSRNFALKESEHPDLAEEWKRYDAVFDRLRERRKFLKKQADALEREGNEEKLRFWPQVFKRAQSAGVIPANLSYDDVSMSWDQGVFYWEKNDDASGGFSGAFPVPGGFAMPAPAEFIKAMLAKEGHTGGDDCPGCKH